MEYKKSSDGNHFYKKVEEGHIIHISHFKEDNTIIEETEFLTTTTEVKKDQCCINAIEKIPASEKTIDISEEEFENELREVVSILGIYKYCKN